MTEEIRRKNFLITEGRRLANGRASQLTPEEWLFLYGQIADYLVGKQAEILAGFETRIRARNRKLSMQSVAL